jgi:hypothetical protein
MTKGLLMSQDNSSPVVPMELFKKKRKGGLTDHERIVFAYHLFENGDDPGAKKLLGEVSCGYFTTIFYKEVARALLCWSISKGTNLHDLGKESEFYVVIYRLYKKIIREELVFKNSGYFTEMKDGLFKGLEV